MQSTLFNFWTNPTPAKHDVAKRIKGFILNFGPQHPASHGVLRLVVQLSGELVERADPHIGFLHRGTEKLIEQRTYLKALPYFDRLDYVSMMAQEHSFCLATETLLNTTHFTSLHARVRVLFDELTRLMNHLLAISTHSLDVGNMAPVFWAFEERERLMEFYERVSGARMHAAFYRPNTLNLNGINQQLFLDIAHFGRDCFKSLIEIYAALGVNKIWKSRLVNIGSITYQDALSYAATGPVGRSAGLDTDMRLTHSETYAYYWFLSVTSFLGKRGDAYDRFLIRIREMFESVSIIFQVLAALQKTPDLYTSHFEMAQTTFYTKYMTMEALIEHFKHYTGGIRPLRGFAYRAVEAPKGEFGTGLISDGSDAPFRCKIRTPAFHHMHIMSHMVQGHLFADLVTVLGSLDIVFGDVDR